MSKKYSTKIIKNDLKKLRIYSENVRQERWGEALELGRHLLKVCRKNNGAGLASIQIGETDRVCVVDVIAPLIMINPFIVWRSLLTIDVKEGCLSLPKKEVVTRRSRSIKVKYIDDQLVPCEKIFGVVPLDKSNEQAILMEAVAVAHELDHLNGELIIDHAVENYL